MLPALARRVGGTSATRVEVVVFCSVAVGWRKRDGLPATRVPASLGEEEEEPLDDEEVATVHGTVALSAGATLRGVTCGRCRAVNVMVLPMERKM